jgi:hypothetical protein
MERNPATGPLSLTDYYPDVNNPVGVGSYSGSMIGSTTLFAPGGGLVPLGMMDARDKAIQDAAYSKAKEYDAFRKMYQAPTTKLVNIQPEISSEYNKMLQGYTQEAKKKYGSQWAKKLETDQNFLAKNKAFQDIAKYGDDIVATRAELDELMKTGKFVMTENLKNTQTKLFSALDPNSPDFKKLGDYYRQYKADINFNQSLNDAVKQIVLNQTGKTWVDDNDPEYLAAYEETVRNMTPDQKKFIEDTLLQQYQGSDMYKPEFIKDNVARFTNFEQKKRDVSITKKNEPSGADVKLDINDIAEESDDISGTTEDANGKIIPASYETFDRHTFKKPIPVIIPVGTKAVDLSIGGKRDQNVENVEAELGGVYNTYVYDNPYGKDAQSKEWQNMMVPKEIKDRGAIAAGLKVVPMVTVRYKTTNANGEEITHSNQVPLASVKDALVGKKGLNKDFYEAIEKKAEERTKNIKGKKTKTQSTNTNRIKSVSKSGKKIYSDDGGNTWKYE